MDTQADYRELLDWLSEGRGELYGCFPPEPETGDRLAQVESGPGAID